MLWIWLLALAAGIVNACVVGADPGRASLVAEHRMPGGSDLEQQAATSGTAVLEHDRGHQHDSPRADTPACVKFCDDESATLPTFKSPAEPAGKVWLFAPPGPVRVAAAQAVPRSLRLSRHIPHRAAVPIPIAFVRLTL